MAILSRRGTSLSALLAIAVAGACAGHEPGGPPGAGTEAAPCNPNPEPVPLRRLTKVQYQNTIRDLFGAEIKPDDHFPGANLVTGFTNDVGLNALDAAGVEAIFHGAEAVSAQVVPLLPKMIACDPAQKGNDACFDAFVAAVARRVYRHPLSPDEAAVLHGVLVKALAAGGFFDALGAVLEVALQSPQFLYLSESGDLDAVDARGMVRLGDYEVASRLSYLLWDSMPDDALLAEAAAGKLRTPEQVAAQARRLIADPRAKAVVARFNREWLELARMDAEPRDPAYFPDYSPELADSMREETRRFVEDAYFDPSATPARLLDSGYTYVDARLAKFYGLPYSGGGWQKVALNPAERAGLLTQASVMTSQGHSQRTAPVLRGKLVRIALLCDSVAPPPGNVPPLPKVDPNVSAKELMAQHRNDPNCASCHGYMDPIGFGFEHYDGIGHYRELEGGKPIDVTGTVSSTGSDYADPAITGAFDGAVELSKKLASSPQVARCIARQWYRFAWAHHEATADSCAVDSLFQRWRGSGLVLEELLVQLTQGEDFLARVKPDVEVSP